MPQNLEYYILKEEKAPLEYETSSQGSKEILLKYYLPKDATISKILLPLKSSIFNENAHQFITLMSTMLGYDNDLVVDKTIFGFMAALLHLVENSFCQI